MRTILSRRRRRFAMSDTGLPSMKQGHEEHDPFLRLFSFQGREPAQFSKAASFDQGINSFVISFLGAIAFLVSLLLIGVLGFWAAPIMVATLVPGSWIATAYIVRRGHDFGWPAHWVIIPNLAGIALMIAAIWFATNELWAGFALCLVPAATFAMCFGVWIMSASGTPGPNRFGPDPRESK